VTLDTLGVEKWANFFFEEVGTLIDAHRLIAYRMCDKTGYQGQHYNRHCESPSQILSAIIG
jgi:hypothetical protein